MATKFAEDISQKTSGFIQSNNHRDLLDIVDSLRYHGVSRYIDLPQIIVCEQQNAFDRRLRAHVKMILTDYAEKMRVDGHALEVVGDGLKPTRSSLEQIHEAAATNFNKISSTVLKEKADKLLEPHLSTHPITYNNYLTETVQDIQAERHNRKFDELSLSGCGYTSQSAPDAKMDIDDDLDPKERLSTLKKETQPDVEEYSASLAADVVAAYYQVALKKFTDDVSVDAIEACLIQRLSEVYLSKHQKMLRHAELTAKSTMFCPDVVWDFSDEHVERLGSEDENTVKERNELTEDWQF
ncbi:hypothetical protein F5Y13DRAFT_195607 [Hypoxylon sp. FL1857]|nr:hypothetical protein F5Y13DRAFT_195607 [Hypoxylon sp. FL1857]